MRDAGEMFLKNRWFLFVVSLPALVAGIVSCAPVKESVRRTSFSYGAYMKGLLTDRLGSFEEAAAHYRRARSLDQKSPSPHIQLGLDYIGLGDLQAAAVEFRAALLLAPDDAQTRYVLALIYAQLNDYKKAAEQYEILLKDAATALSQKTQLRRILSQLYFLGGDFVTARKYSKDILTLDPLDQDALYFMGLISSEQGASQEAEGFFKKVLEYYPDDADAANSLAFLYAEKGEHLVEALDLALQATGAEGDNGAYLDALGWVYFQLGDAPKAVVFLEKASRIMMDPVVLNHLAAGYERLGDREKARKQWEMSLALDPSQGDIREKLRNIKR